MSQRSEAMRSMLNRLKAFQQGQIASGKVDEATQNWMAFRNQMIENSIHDEELADLRDASKDDDSFTVNINSEVKTK